MANATCRKTQRNIQRTTHSNPPASFKKNPTFRAKNPRKPTNLSCSYTKIEQFLNVSTLSLSGVERVSTPARSKISLDLEQGFFLVRSPKEEYFVMPMQRSPPWLCMPAESDACRTSPPKCDSTNHRIVPTLLDCCNANPQSYRAPPHQTSAMHILFPIGLSSTTAMVAPNNRQQQHIKQDRVSQPFSLKIYRHQQSDALPTTFLWVHYLFCEPSGAKSNFSSGLPVSTYHLAH